MNRCSLRSKRSMLLACWGCLLLLLVCLTVRLLWLAAETETGLQCLSAQWQDATVGWIVGGYRPISSRPPSEQAKYWLGEVDRVLAVHPNDAPLMIGASVVLDLPDTGFLTRHVKRSQPAATSGPGPSSPGFDGQGIKQAEDSFEERCGQRGLELAATAAHLEPNSVEWWQWYALLLYRQAFPSRGDTPRDPDWLGLLDECARHDPDNALYDYLAVHFYWRAGATIDVSGMQERLVIRNREKFEKGVARFEQGLTRRRFAVGNAVHAAPEGFLLHTQVPRIDHVPIVEGRATHLRLVMLLRDVRQWQQLRAEQEASAANFTAALRLSRQNLRLIEQYDRGAPTTWELMSIVGKTATTTQMQKFADADRDNVSPSERQQILAVHEAAILQNKILGRVIQNLPNKSSPLTGVSTGREFVTCFLAGYAPMLMVLLLLLGLLATILSPRSDDIDIPVVGPVAHVSALAVALATTTVLFGLAPAEIISPPVQSWFFTAGLLFVPITLVTWASWCWLRRRAFQFSIRAMLMLTLIVALFLSLVAVVRPEDFFGHFPFPLSIPASGNPALDIASFGKAFTSNYGQWAWVLFQWGVYCGPCLTVVLWAGFVGVLYRRKVKRRQTEQGTPSSVRPRRFRGIFRSMGQPSLLMAAMIFLVYLFLAPATLQKVERDFQDKIAVFRHPEASWNDLEKAAEKILADEQVMSELKALAKAEAAKGTVSISAK